VLWGTRHASEQNIPRLDLSGCGNQSRGFLPGIKSTMRISHKDEAECRPASNIAIFAGITSNSDRTLLIKKLATLFEVVIVNVLTRSARYLDVAVIFVRALGQQSLPRRSTMLKIATAEVTALFIAGAHDS
jgi:hypothetical protein